MTVIFLKNVSGVNFVAYLVVLLCVFSNPDCIVTCILQSWLYCYVYSPVLIVLCVFSSPDCNVYSPGCYVGTGCHNPLAPTRSKNTIAILKCYILHSCIFISSSMISLQYTILPPEIEILQRRHVVGFKKMATLAILTFWGVGIFQRLEWHHDWKVAGLNPCWSGKRIFFSWVNFLCWLLFQYPFYPHVTAVAHKRSRSFCQKCRSQVTA